MVVALALFGLWIFCLLDVLVTPGTSCRRLPKFAWFVVILLFSWIGSILWLAAGRPWGAAARSQDSPRNHRAAVGQKYELAVRSNEVDAAAAEARYRQQFRARVEEQRARYQESLSDEDG
jgi:hypothetical protein